MTADVAVRMLHAQARSTESSADGSEAACAPLRTSHRDQEDTPHTTAEFRMFQFKVGTAVGSSERMSAGQTILLC